MIFDSQNLFSEDQAVTSSAASTNVIDLGATGTPSHGPSGGATALERDLGKGCKIPVRIQVTEDFATLTSLQVSVQVDTVENFASPTTVAQTAAIAAASLVAGYVFNIDTVPLGADQRYMRLYYTVAGAAATAGTIMAGVTAANQTNP